ncbi:MAG TPA: N-acetylmuramoyl-L-alanine amidase [Chthoniobacterales bacterium]|nr:N-acetylmuramoyl-L-alanine amidase [Chthoniobacterales bacterium]
MRGLVWCLIVVFCFATTVEAKSKRKRRSVSAPSVYSGPFSTVVIDAGHGGHDRGGIRQNIIPEKGVALDVALRLSDSLRAAGLRTVLTRKNDTFIPLGRRVAIANAHRDAVFVSIHFNSGRRLAARGIETYYYSSASSGLASRIHSAVLSTTTGDNRGIRRRGYYVLRRPSIRAVLVECGFLTNRQDAALAQSAAYRQKLADRIAGAIISYRGQFR